MTQQFELFDICQNHHRGNTESVSANTKVNKGAQRLKVLSVIRQYPSTCEEVEDETFLPHQSASARISELKRDGFIRKIGTRPTRSGCQAAVYQVS